MPLPMRGAHGHDGAQLERQLVVPVPDLAKEDPIVEVREFGGELAQGVVAREESMTEAANVLHVTQPTLSRQIAELERELGCTLFDRTNRATMLTEDGMRLRQRAEEILSRGPD
ncbi:LysR family transcriptional regulator [uncultured Parolsenella sp.]|uniref:LysR family transcriptional regulator n=1 Tax=uncultured Parolsenella sp. TaxID=2083008 RepID=UPI00280602F7|nr:LysR family transcriptional regulator [uncultured Parolsenella sp.]